MMQLLYSKIKYGVDTRCQSLFIFHSLRRVNLEILWGQHQNRTVERPQGGAQSFLWAEAKNWDHATSSSEKMENLKQREKKERESSSMKWREKSCFDKCYVLRLLWKICLWWGVSSALFWRGAKRSTSKNWNKINGIKKIIK